MRCRAVTVIPQHRAGCPWLPQASQVWLGVSVEDKRHGLPWDDVLRGMTTGTGLFSIEPLLEDIGRIDLTGIDWVIVGGESGRKARPMDIDWVKSIREQCIKAQVPFFFKQWGGMNR